MEHTNKRKFLGGAEKQRERNKTILRKEAKKCKKINDMFKPLSLPIQSIEVSRYLPRYLIVLHAYNL